MRKKILIIAPFFPPNVGGAETFAYNLAKELSRDNDISVLAFQPMNGQKAAYYEVADYIEVVRIDWPFNPGKIWQGTSIKNFLLVFPKMLYWAILWQKRRKFAMVLANGLISCAVASLLRFWGVKGRGGILHAFYGFKGRNALFKAFTRVLLSGIDKLFVEGELVRQDLIDIRIPESRLAMYCHWCDQTKFRPPAKRNNKKMVVLCTGRLDLPEKGIHIIKYVEAGLKEKEIEFVYIENVPHEVMPKYFQMADVVVVPSLYAESYPIVVIEAASSGCAIITTDKGALPELTKGFGWIAEEDYIINFKNIILMFYENKDALKIAQKQSYEYALKHFSPRNAEIFLK